MKIDALDGLRVDEFVGTSIRMEKSLDQDLVRIAAEEKVTKSQLMRYALKTFVEEYDKM